MPLKLTKIDPVGKDRTCIPQGRWFKSIANVRTLLFLFASPTHLTFSPTTSTCPLKTTSTSSLPRFWKKAFKAAYKDLTSYVMEIPNPTSNLSKDNRRYCQRRFPIATYFFFISSPPSLSPTPTTPSTSWTNNSKANQYYEIRIPFSSLLQPSFQLIVFFDEIIVDMHCAESWVWLRVPFYGEVVVGDSDMVAMTEEEPGYCYVCKIGYYNDMLANGFEKIEHDIVEN
ncbi:hypothetical protein JHK84_045487 [Glycine max]|nr:hypothetical protein JHK84_045487 [Glycine max]